MTELRDASTLLADLVSFEAAARLGSFSRAAEALGVSQPAVSLRVRQLEKRALEREVLRKGRVRAVRVVVGARRDQLGRVDQPYDGARERSGHGARRARAQQEVSSTPGQSP